MMRAGAVGMMLAATLVLACGSDVETSDNGGSGGQGASAGSGGTGASAGNGGMGAGGGGTGGASGECSPSQPCTNDGFCVYPLGACEPDAIGMCQLGFTCDGPPTGPVCQCDGTVLEGEYAVCDAWEGSLQLTEPATCATGTFSCGDTQCVRHAEVCVETLPGPAGPTQYSCVPANGSCSGIPDCSCLDLMALGCPDTSCCSADADQQETVTIALP